MEGKVYEGERMSENLKKMFQELMEDHERLQKSSTSKEVEYMETIIKINSSHKKTNK